eukprot:2970187-Rhodomonas_salina.4
MPEDQHGHKINELYCFCDASFADDPVNWLLMIGYIIFLNGAPICYRTKFTPTVVGSSTHAEVAAVCMALQDISQLRDLLASMSAEQEGPTPVYEDNESCMAIANNKRTTHNKAIEVRYQIIREYVRKRIIVLVPVGTDHQLADIMTKALGSAKFNHCADEIIVYSEDFIRDRDS